MHRLVSGTIAAAALLVSSCAGSTSSATGVAEQQPLPTIGLGTGIGDDGIATGGADVRSVGTPEIDTLVMVGDSITVASMPALQDVFARLGFDNVIIEAQESKRTADGGQSNPSGVSIASGLVESIESGESAEWDDDPADHSNELWVVALGTNDINQYSDPVERAAAINEMLDAVPVEATVVWVDTYIRNRPDGTDEINDTIIDRVGRRGNSVIARWSAVADDDGNLRTDGVHPRDQGSIVFADTVADTISDLLQLG